MSAGRAKVWLGGGLIVAAVVAAYLPSLGAPFIFDDQPAIVDNQAIRHLGTSLLTPPGASGLSGRPLVSLSLALNYAWGGLDVRGYHALNTAIHLLAALVLYGIVRRTLLRWNRPATLAAFATALVWAVHPLLTESVTCVIQRNESMVGLFYLLTVYGFIRSDESEVAVDPRATVLPPPGPFAVARWSTATSWKIVSILACLLGMATKEVMATAPFIVFLYDRTFVAGTFAEAWQRRRGYYLGLAATWLLLAGILVHQGGSRGTAAGFGFGVSPADYALTQCRAVVHYLRLAFWPHPLVLDYGTGVDHRLGAVWPQAVLLAALLGATGWALRSPRRGGRALGFAGAWFFIILAPSSSVVPLVTQTIAEHRMYLPLAAVIAVVVLGVAEVGRPGLGRPSSPGYAGASRLDAAGRAGPPYQHLKMAVFVLCALSLGLATVRRNRDYRSAVAIWRATAEARPLNPRAHNNLGLALAESGQPAAALGEYRRALALDPDFGDAEDDLGVALADLGRDGEAIPHFERAIQLARHPSAIRAHNSLGLALVRQGKPEAAIAQYRRALAGDPEFAEAENNLGLALAQTGRAGEALSHYERALALRPGSAGVEVNEALALLDAGRPDEAMRLLEEIRTSAAGEPKVGRGGPPRRSESAGRAGPPYLGPWPAGVRRGLAQGYVGEGTRFERAGRTADAIAAYERAVELEPADSAVHYNLGIALRAAGRTEEAIGQYREALRLSPGLAPAENNLGIALVETGRPKEALEHFQAALRLKPDYRQARENLALVRRMLAR